MTNNFMIGVNYWASNAGTAMWSRWSPECVEKDLETLSKNGVSYLRVFPLWSDFQPVKPMYTGGNFFKEYRMEDESLCDNPYYLSAVMLERFDKFLDICSRYDIKVIVGLITGFMSGRTFVPPAVYGKNLYSDSTALMFEQKFVKGFVSHFANREEICAWDLGNECNCMSVSESRESVYVWISLITDAVKSQDSRRPVLSGTTALNECDSWKASDMAECVDIMTTHPYPLWTPYGSKDKMSSIRTLLLSACSNKYEEGLGQKPCLVEETGTMGPMICDEYETASGFARVNLMSCFVNGSLGLFWWCACDQTNLKTAPYTWSKCELELGMMNTDGNPKPVLHEFGEFQKWMSKYKINLPKATDNGIILVSDGNEQWGISYMAYILSRQAGVNVSFSYINSEIPDSDVYILPSVSGDRIISGENYNQLFNKVYDGATVYISNDNGFLSEFEKYTGLRVEDTDEHFISSSFELDEKNIEFCQNNRRYLRCVGAEVLASCNGNPVFTKFSYGNGTVYYLDCPIEKNLLDKGNAFDGDYFEIYRYVFADCKRIVDTRNKNVAVTEHISDSAVYVTAINYSDKCQKAPFMISEDYEIEEIYMGCTEQLEQYGSFVAKVKIKQGV